MILLAWLVAYSTLQYLKVMNTAYLEVSKIDFAEHLTLNIDLHLPIIVEQHSKSGTI